MMSNARAPSLIRNPGFVAACVRQLTCVALCSLALLAGTNQGARATGQGVDLALVLAIDVSNSVDWFEYQMQKRGLAYAIQDREVVDAIQRGSLGRIAISVVQWSGARSQRVAIPWTILSDAASADGLSRTLNFMPREYGGHATSISGAIAFATEMLANPPFNALRKVIDVSGDGRDNVDPRPDLLRDAAVAAGISINGLAIENDEPDLRQHYRQFIIGGPGAFVIAIKRYEDFAEAMKKKLLREIAPQLLSLYTPADRTWLN